MDVAKLVKALEEIELKWLCNDGAWHGMPQDQIQGVIDALDEYEKVTGIRLDRGRGE